MRFALLGPMTVSCRDELIEVRGPLPRAVLAALLLNANTPVPTTSTADRRALG